MDRRRDLRFERNPHAGEVLAGCRLQDARHKTQDTRRKTQDTGHKTQDARRKTQDTRRKTQDAREELQATSFKLLVRNLFSVRLLLIADCLLLFADRYFARYNRNGGWS